MTMTSEPLTVPDTVGTQRRFVEGRIRDHSGMSLKRDARSFERKSWEF
jgi:hypothetical protein